MQINLILTEEGNNLLALLIGLAKNDHTGSIVDNFWELANEYRAEYEKGAKSIDIANWMV